MAKNYKTFSYFESRPDVVKIFEDLEAFHDYCRIELFPFDESHLYNEKTPWGEFQRVLAGKYPKDNWSPHPKPERTTFRPRDNNYRARY